MGVLLSSVKEIEGGDLGSTLAMHVWKVVVKFEGLEMGHMQILFLEFSKWLWVS